ncbi:argininosuccinate synthase [Atractiella rhizophila]|nr:argininosuccinate synthase [Atractiella rhizophila]
MASKGRVMLAYSGGLDTSCILAWLIEQGYNVHAFMADVGQEEDFEAAEKKALKVGAEKFHLVDLKEEFVTKLVWPAVQANAIYENVYLLGTSLARPVIARAMIEVASKEDCQFVSHGCTGKGNDQVRFELAFYALQPGIKVIAPWRIPEFYNRFAGRTDLLNFAAEKGIPVAQTKAKPWSTDENLFHISYEAGILEDPDTTPPEDMWKLTRSLPQTPSQPSHITLTFESGLPVSLVVHSSSPLYPNDYKAPYTPTSEPITTAVPIFLALNALARLHGIGRLDIVENRFIGVKSRGCYESPAGTILRVAHMDIEGLVMDRNVRNIRDGWITNELGRILYNGFWWSPEREFVEACVKQSQKGVDGKVRLRLERGNVIVEGRSSESSNLYDASESSMDELGGFSPVDASGFIAIESIRLKKWGSARLAKGEDVTAASVYKA